MRWRGRLCRWTHRLGIETHFCKYVFACSARTPKQEARLNGFIAGMDAERKRWMVRHTHEWRPFPGENGRMNICWCNAIEKIHTP